MPSQEEIISEFNQFIEQTLVRQAQNLSDKEGVSNLPNPPYQGGDQATQPSAGLLIPTDTVNSSAPNAGGSGEENDFPTPTIPSALVAEDDGDGGADPIWTTSIGAAVGGVLVQQADGETPAFVGGTSATAQVLTIDAADDLAKWIPGVPLISPTIASALVASAANTPVWTSGISPGVGGVLVQQADGSTPAFVSGMSGSKQVLAITSTTAGWVEWNGPCDDGTHAPPCCGDSATNDGKIPLCGGGFYDPPDDNTCNAGVYLQSDGAGRFQCGLPGATAATDDTVVERDARGGIHGKYIEGIAVSGDGVYGETDDDGDSGVHGKCTGDGFGVTGEGVQVGGQFSGALGMVAYGTTRHAEFGLAGGGAVPARIELDGSYQVNEIQVVTAQQAAVADATGLGDVVTQLNDLLAKLRTHGLIDT